MSKKEQEKKFVPKRYVLEFPHYWGLDSTKTYVAVETEKGYAIRLTIKSWIGLPKDLVEDSPDIFKLETKDGPGED